MEPSTESIEELTVTADSISVTGSFTNIEDDYDIDPSVLGEGHNGRVRMCIERSTGIRYAVKTIRKDIPDVEAGGLSREINLLRELHHHSIVRLVDVYEDVDSLHVVTDLCTGGELYKKIVHKSESDNGSACFAEDEAASLMYQILTVVCYLHRRGIVHRDIKPENILFESADQDSPIKLIDFGLARKHFTVEPPMTSTVGTICYMAPEVLQERYDNACNLWSVGVIAYTMLSGYHPFTGVNDDETRHNILNGLYTFPFEEWNGTSREARDFINKLLQTDPRKRMTIKQALKHPWIVRHTSIELEKSIEKYKEEPIEKVDATKTDLPMKSSLLSSRIVRLNRMRFRMLRNRQCKK